MRREIGSPSSYPVFVHASLERVPPTEIGSKEREFEASGWVWIERNQPGHIVLMRKDFSAPVSEREIEGEIRNVMGLAYVGLAAAGSPKALDGEIRGEAASASDPFERVDDPARTELPEHRDSDGHIHGGAQLIRGERDPDRSDEEQH